MHITSNQHRASVGSRRTFRSSIARSTTKVTRTNEVVVLASSREQDGHLPALQAVASGNRCFGSSREETLWLASSTKAAPSACDARPSSPLFTCVGASHARAWRSEEQEEDLAVSKDPENRAFGACRRVQRVDCLRNLRCVNRRDESEQVQREGGPKKSQQVRGIRARAHRQVSARLPGNFRFKSEAKAWKRTWNDVSKPARTMRAAAFRIGARTWMSSPPFRYHKSSPRCKAPCTLGRRQWLEGFVSDASVGHLSNHNATNRACPAGIGSVMARSMSGLQGNTSASESEFIAVYVTVPSAEAGKAIASKLISDKLAACVNMIPGIQSMYWWEGKVEVDEELLLKIKSRAQLFDALSKAVVEAHPYDVPEVIALPITSGNKGYLDWLASSTGMDDA